MWFDSKKDCLDYFSNAFNHIGAMEADIIYVYSDFRFFSQYLHLFDSKIDFCNSLTQLLLSKGKTILVTTFSYTSEGNFEVLETPTNLGVLNRWILNQKDYSRSEHPMYSYAALGPKKHILENIGKSAFGKKSVFDRLQGQKAGFLHIGRPVEFGNTALHFVEQSCGATYRYNKCFKTNVFRGGAYLGTDYSVNVRRLDVENEDFIYTFHDATKSMRQRKLIQEVGESSNLSNISFYWYDSFVNFLIDQFYKDETIFINSTYKKYD